MGPIQLLGALRKIVEKRIPVFIHGKPGIGKSDIVRQVAKELKIQLIDVRAVLLDPVDVRGIPNVTNGKTTWNPPDFWPKSGKGILFLDELSAAPAAVQSALLQLTLDRRIAEYELPEGFTIIAAGNRQEDRAGAHRLISPLLNRFIHFDLDVDNDAWHSWAIGNSIHPLITSFLKFKPNFLGNVEPKSDDKAFPTPRSWSFVNSVIGSDFNPEANDAHYMVAGCIGKEVAGEFLGYAQVYSKLPDVDTILKNPEGATLPQEPSVCFAVIGMLAHKAVKCTQKDGEAILTYCSRLSDEYSMALFRDCIQVNQNIMHYKCGDALLKKFHHILDPK